MGPSKWSSTQLFHIPPPQVSLTANTPLAIQNCRGRKNTHKASGKSRFSGAAASDSVCESGPFVSVSTPLTDQPLPKILFKRFSGANTSMIISLAVGKGLRALQLQSVCLAGRTVRFYLVSYPSSTFLSLVKRSCSLLCVFCFSFYSLHSETAFSRPPGEGVLDRFKMAEPYKC